jgi:hypothetical protein
MGCASMHTIAKKIVARYILLILKTIMSRYRSSL